VNKKGFGLEIGLFEQGRLIFGERKERAEGLRCGCFGTRENTERERDTWKLGSLMTKHQWYAAPA